jgi:hypothetical protein
MTFPTGKLMALPPELEPVRAAARKAISPIKPADSNTKADPQFLFSAVRTNAGRKLPPYYLVYFLFVDLLGFQNLGRFEKLAWSVPIDFEGVAYLIEHRKFGVGIFAHNGNEWEEPAKQIVGLIRRSVTTAKPFFRWLADNAVRASKFNVRNVGIKLLRRYTFFRDEFRQATSEALRLRKDHKAAEMQRKLSFQLYSARIPKGASWLEHYELLSHPWIKRSENASWLALAAIEAFFGWTEHIFIHLAILQGRVTTGKDVAEMVEADWSAKFKRAFDLRDRPAKRHFDELVALRRQLRNFVAHGAFGKEGEAFSFHSKVGAVPVALDHTAPKAQFSLTPEWAFEDTKAIAAIEAFISFMWSGSREPAKIYIQESELPIILPYASDGTYRAAMASREDMQQHVDHMTGQWDMVSNMDW